MDKNIYYQLLIIKYLVDANNQDTGAIKQALKKQYTKFTKIYSDSDKIKIILKQPMVHHEYYSVEKMDVPNTQNPDTLFLANKKAPPLEGGNSMKIGGMWTLKHETNSPKLYEILIKTELKGCTALDFKNF